jgi:hypothetical protein
MRPVSEEEDTPSKKQRLYYCDKPLEKNRVRNFTEKLAMVDGTHSIVKTLRHKRSIPNGNWSETDLEDNLMDLNTWGKMVAMFSKNELISLVSMADPGIQIIASHTKKILAQFFLKMELQIQTDTLSRVLNRKLADHEKGAREKEFNGET